jgi:uncharacterized protein (TIGR01777 family)
VVNYVGRSVDCRKTPANRKVILESRIDSINALAAGFRESGSIPGVWVQAGTAHIFGDTGDELIDESSPIGTGFAPQVGTAWEKSLMDQDLHGCRRVIMRMSFVMGRGGGALTKLSRLARCFLGGTVGSGDQYISWIHVADLNAIVLRALFDPSVAGMYVVTAPQPVTNRQFMRLLRRAVHRPWSPPTPAPLVRVGSRLMGSDPELALFGRRCVPTRLQRENFVFQFPELEPALADLMRR